MLELPDSNLIEWDGEIGGDYSEFLDSDEWKQKSNHIKELYGNECAICGSKKDLVTHHKTYKYGRMCSDEHLICLCKNCHRFIHNIAIPTLNSIFYQKAKLSYLVSDFYFESYIYCGTPKFNYWSFINHPDSREKFVLSIIYSSYQLSDWRLETDLIRLIEFYESSFISDSNEIIKTVIGRKECGNFNKITKNDLMSKYKVSQKVALNIIKDFSGITEEMWNWATKKINPGLDYLSFNQKR